ncbi:Imm52 family immunity protein [Myxococcus sp. RHSTA-1-4]|uniref:Imm52 family immunity protein n=1 Tax=Myxococcus sp. RHSTA-1-4 TaxID=2874601 RepID=UPI00351D857A
MESSGSRTGRGAAREVPAVALRGGAVIEQLGFGFWFDNGGSGRDCADVRIYRGGDSEAVSSSCFLSPPSQGPNAERVFTAPVLASHRPGRHPPQGVSAEGAALRAPSGRGFASKRRR